MTFDRKISCFHGHESKEMLHFIERGQNNSQPKFATFTMPKFIETCFRRLENIKKMPTVFVWSDRNLKVSMSFDRKTKYKSGNCFSEPWSWFCADSKSISLTRCDCDTTRQTFGSAPNTPVAFSCVVCSTSWNIRVLKEFESDNRMGSARKFMQKL